MRTPTIGLATFLVACTGDPLPAFETGGTAAMVGGALRVVREYSDERGPRLQTLVAARDGDPAPALDIQIDGAPLDGSVAEIAGIGDRGYLVWSEAHDHVVSHRGAPLAGDMTIDSATAIDLGTDVVELRRVGDRFLAVHEPEEPLLGGDRVLTASWIHADGTLERTGDLVATREFAITDDPDGRAGLFAIVYERGYFNQGPDLMVKRMLPDGTVLDPDGILITSSTDTAWPGTTSIAALPGGDILLIYEMADQRHAVTIARDGTLADHIVELSSVPQLVVGDRVLALTLADPTVRDVPIEARILDASGNVASGPVSAGSVEDAHFAAVPTPDGFALVHHDVGFRVTWLDRDGASIGETP